MSLAGKFFVHVGASFTHAGEIVEQVDAATVLVRIDRVEGTASSMMLFATKDMLAALDAGGVMESPFELFSSRAELDAWMAWMESPDDDEIDPAEKKNVAGMH